MTKSFAAVLALAASAFVPSVASAGHHDHSSFGFSIGFGSGSYCGPSYSSIAFGYSRGWGGGYYNHGYGYRSCAPVYYAPRAYCPPVVYAPPPVVVTQPTVVYSQPVYTPPPVVYTPAPVYYSTPAYTPAPSYYSGGAVYYGR